MGSLTVLNRLPFSLPDEFGKVIHSRTECPGVYYATQNVLTVCYPLQADYSSDAVNLSRLTDYDAKHDLDSAMGYMFFSEKDSCVPLFELLEPRAEWENCINKAALNNAILEYHPEYAMMHNSREIQGLNDHLE